MDTFFAHHRKSIRFRYRCFDRILLNALIQPFQQPERVVGFFGSYRKLYPVSRDILRGIAERFQNWVSESGTEVGCSDRRGSPRPARRVRGSILPAGQT